MTEALCCNKCGAPLEVPDSARFVKCNHCNSQLVIHRTESTTFTEVVDQLSKTTESLQEQVEKLQHQQALESLDRN